MSGASLKPTVADRVSTGAAWLDAHRPGWAERIDMLRLDLSDGRTCILGQEYNTEVPLNEFDPWEGMTGFQVGIQHLPYKTDLWFSTAAAAHGFDIDPNTEGDRDDFYDQLQHVWESEIESRLNA